MTRQFPPLRGEPITENDIPTLRFIEYLEALDPAITEDLIELSGAAEAGHGSQIATLDQRIKYLEENTEFSLSAFFSARISRAKFQIEVSADYTVTGDFDLEVVTCTNTVGTNVTITMPVHYETAQVIVTKGSTGRVTLDGNGTNIIGLPTQELVMQDDSAHMYGKSDEWGLR